MDITIFKRQLQKAYNQADCTFSLDECLDIFLYYFSAYREYMGIDHAPIKTDRLIEILESINGYEDLELDAEFYRDMIILYFTTPFKNCDRNICHFFSGDIRKLRYYEMQRGDAAFKEKIGDFSTHSALNAELPELSNAIKKGGLDQQ